MATVNTRFKSECMTDSSQIFSVLSLVAGLQIKHFICDGPLQTKAMVDSKSKYGDGLGIVHSAIHGIGTAVVLLLWLPAGILLLGLAVLDFVVHYHTDYAKENIVKRAGWTTSDAKFWWALSADQTLHQLTYIVLTYLALTI